MNIYSKSGDGSASLEAECDLNSIPRRTTHTHIRTSGKRKIESGDLSDERQLSKVEIEGKKIIQLIAELSPFWTKKDNEENIKSIKNLLMTPNVNKQGFEKIYNLHRRLLKDKESLSPGELNKEDDLKKTIESLDFSSNDPILYEIFENLIKHQNYHLIELMLKKGLNLNVVENTVLRCLQNASSISPRMCRLVLDNIKDDALSKILNLGAQAFWPNYSTDMILEKMITLTYIYEDYNFAEYLCKRIGWIFKFTDSELFSYSKLINHTFEYPTIFKIFLEGIKTKEEESILTKIFTECLFEGHFKSAEILIDFANERQIPLSSSEIGTSLYKLMQTSCQDAENRYRYPSSAGYPEQYLKKDALLLQVFKFVLNVLDLSLIDPKSSPSLLYLSLGYKEIYDLLIENGVHPNDALWDLLQSGKTSILNYKTSDLLVKFFKDDANFNCAKSLKLEEEEKEREVDILEMTIRNLGSKAEDKDCLGILEILFSLGARFNPKIIDNVERLVFLFIKNMDKIKVTNYLLQKLEESFEASKVKTVLNELFKRSIDLPNQIFFETLFWKVSNQKDVFKTLLWSNKIGVSNEAKLQLKVDCFLRANCTNFNTDEDHIFIVKLIQKRCLNSLAFIFKNPLKFNLAKYIGLHLHCAAFGISGDNTTLKPGQVPYIIDNLYKICPMNPFDLVGLGVIFADQSVESNNFKHYKKTFSIDRNSMMDRSSIKSSYLSARKFCKGKLNWTDDRFEKNYVKALTRPVLTHREDIHEKLLKQRAEHSIEAEGEIKKLVDSGTLLHNKISAFRKQILDDWSQAHPSINLATHQICAICNLSDNKQDGMPMSETDRKDFDRYLNLKYTSIAILELCDDLFKKKEIDPHSLFESSKSLLIPSEFTNKYYEKTEDIIYKLIPIIKNAFSENDGHNWQLAPRDENETIKRFDYLWGLITPLCGTSLEAESKDRASDIVIKIQDKDSIKRIIETVTNEEEFILRIKKILQSASDNCCTSDYYNSQLDINGNVNAGFIGLMLMSLDLIQYDCKT